LRRTGRHEGRTRPSGWRLCEITGNGGARDLIRDPKGQKAIADIVRLRGLDEDQGADG
jgi:hypothetical protein